MSRDEAPLLHPLPNEFMGPMPEPPALPGRNTRVTKTLWPQQPGTLKLLQRYGPALLCVRYRHDASHQRRYTTVEIVVDEAALPPRARRRWQPGR